MAKMTIDDLVPALQQAYGDALRSVVLYGSAVAGEHIKKKSDYNILVVVEELPLERLLAASQFAKKWSDAGNPPPMIFTTREWQTASDIYPLEYVDIRARHQVLLGEDPFADIAIELSNLRMEVEREAISKVLRLRQATQITGPDPKKQIEILAASFSSLMVILRGVMWLHNSPPSQNYGELIRDSAVAVGFDPQAYFEVLHHVRGERAIPKDRAQMLLASYIHGMEVVAMHVDGLNL